VSAVGPWGRRPSDPTTPFAFTFPDITPPAVAITNPTGESTFATSATPLPIGGTASDNVGVNEVTWTTDRGGSGTATGTTTWSARVALQVGSNVMMVTAPDAAGNTGSQTLTVAYAPPPPPAITITAPTRSPTYAATASPLAVGGTASGVGVTRVTWTSDRGASGAATGTTTWSASVPLKSGPNLITVTVSDAAGNSRTDTLTVTLRKK